MRLLVPVLFLALLGCTSQTTGGFASQDDGHGSAHGDDDDAHGDGHGDGHGDDDDSTAAPECAYVEGSVLLPDPPPEAWANLLVATFEPEQIQDNGLPGGQSTDERLFDSAAFPQDYGMCSREGTVVVLAMLDANQDDELCSPGDRFGSVTLETIDGEVTPVSDIVLDGVVTQDGCGHAEEP